MKKRQILTSIVAFTTASLITLTGFAGNYINESITSKRLPETTALYGTVQYLDGKYEKIKLEEGDNLLQSPRKPHHIYIHNADLNSIIDASTTEEGKRKEVGHSMKKIMDDMYYPKFNIFQTRTVGDTNITIDDTILENGLSFDIIMPQIQSNTNISLDFDIYGVSDKDIEKMDAVNFVFSGPNGKEVTRFDYIKDLMSGVSGFGGDLIDEDPINVNPKDIRKVGRDGLLNICSILPTPDLRQDLFAYYSESLGLGEEIDSVKDYLNNRGQAIIPIQSLLSDEVEPEGKIERVYVGTDDKIHSQWFRYELDFDRQHLWAELVKGHPSSECIALANQSSTPPEISVFPKVYAGEISDQDATPSDSVRELIGKHEAQVEERAAAIEQKGKIPEITAPQNQEGIPVKHSLKHSAKSYWNKTKEGDYYFRDTYVNSDTKQKEEITVYAKPTSDNQKNMKVEFIGDKFLVDVDGIDIDKEDDAVYQIRVIEQDGDRRYFPVSMGLANISKSYGNKIFEQRADGSWGVDKDAAKMVQYFSFDDSKQKNHRLEIISTAFGETFGDKVASQQQVIEKIVGADYKVADNLEMIASHRDNQLSKIMETKAVYPIDIKKAA